MKSNLVLSILLLASLVLADLPAPSLKMLYDNDHLLIESFDARMLRHNYYSQKMMFFTQNNNSFGLTEFLMLNGSFKNESWSLAVESFDYAPDDKPDEVFCVNNSDELFRSFIYICKGHIRVRNLTEEEQNQMQQFKDEQGGVDMSFKVIFDKRTIRTKSQGLDELSVANLPQSNNQETFSVSAAVTYALDRTSKYRDLKVVNNLTERSFVVEGLSEHDTFDCYNADPADLKPINCEGQIQLRPLKDDD